VEPEDPERPPARAVVNHVGLTVPDLDAALAWYQEVLGFTLLTPPAELDAADPQLGAALEEMLGPRVRRFRMAHLSSANGVGIQMFEFIDPPSRPRDDPTAFWELGLFHLCVADADIERLAARIEASGGQRSTVWRQIPDAPYAACYCTDPFGNVIEINSHGYEETRTFLEDGYRSGT
jgi:catechol 2,3-dioxygenase-like lactoylglutathione lyase family enzyme